MQTNPAANVETDRELKAYIYQQLVELQPYLIPESQMSVTVQHVLPVATAEESADDTDDFEERIVLEDVDSPEDGVFLVTLVTTMEGGKLEAEGLGENVYQAFGKAKIEMVELLNAIHNSAVDSADRDEEIQSWLNGEHTVH